MTSQCKAKFVSNLRHLEARKVIHRIKKLTDFD